MDERSQSGGRKQERGRTLTACSLLASLVVIALAPEARACKCAHLTVAQRVDAADAIFEGRVRNREQIELRDSDFGDAGYRYDFDVVRVWKGRAVERRLVTSGLSSASCGIPYEVGETYLVVAFGSDEELLTDTCGGLPRWDDAVAFLAALGPPRSEFALRPLEAAGEPSRLVVWGALGVVAIGLLMVWWRRRSALRAGSDHGPR